MTLSCQKSLIQRETEGQLSLQLSPSSLRWDFESQMGSYRTEGPEALKGSSLGTCVGALSFSFRSQTASF